MFAIVICLVVFMCTLTILSFVLCVLMVEGMSYVSCSECNVVYNECNEPTSCLVQPIGAHCREVMNFGGVLDVCLCFGCGGVGGVGGEWVGAWTRDWRGGVISV